MLVDDVRYSPQHGISVKPVLPVEVNRHLLVDSGLEHQPFDAHPSRRKLEASQNGAPDTLAPLVRLDIHALDLRGGRLEHANGAATDGCGAVPGDEKLPPAGLELFRLEIRAEPLFRPVELSQTGIQLSDQALGVGRVQRLRVDGEGQTTTE